MLRQIINPQPGIRLNNPENPDDFKTRLIKMIPGEVVAVYLACNTAVTQFGIKNYVAYWIVFGIILLLTPLYLKRVMNINDIVQILIMTVAFILWCITIDKPFDSLFADSKQQQLFSTLALSIYTFAIPIFYRGT